MKSPHKIQDGSKGRFFLTAFVLAALLNCSAPQPRLTGVAYEYDSAKDMLKKGRFDKALEFSEAPAKATPPNAFTLRAQVFQVAVYSGLIHGHKELADSYRTGSDKTNNPQFKAAYERQRNDAVQYGSRLALGLAELAHKITELKTLETEYTLDAPYPSAEAPLTLPQLAKVTEGGWIDPDEQEAVGKDALLKGINDALADLVGGDLSKARAALSAGPVKIEGTDFGLYLGRELVTAASMFDKKHMRDSTKLKLICGEADEAAQAAAALIKEKPDKAKEKALKKLQDDIKTTLRVM